MSFENQVMKTEIPLNQMGPKIPKLEGFNIVHKGIEKREIE